MSILPLQAGLTVGDLILAVNKDTLLGSNYDAVSNKINKIKCLQNSIHIKFANRRRFFRHHHY
jgi:hypothetical protein